MIHQYPVGHMGRFTMIGAVHTVVDRYLVEVKKHAEVRDQEAEDQKNEENRAFFDEECKELFHCVGRAEF